MAELKTKLNDASVEDYLNTVADAQRREDSFAVMELMREVTGQEPKMWGGSIVGFGSYHYRYATGREGDWPPVAFSPRKQNLVLYLTGGYEQHAGLLEKLGKHSIGRSCLYVKKLDDLHLPTLKKLIEASFQSTVSGEQ